MTHEAETGFGTGLRAQLSRKLGIEETPEAEATPAVVQEPPEELLPLGELLPIVQEAMTDEPAEVTELRSELERALTRERALREALEHQVEAYERELASARELAVREAELEQRVARAEATHAELEEQIFYPAMASVDNALVGRFIPEHDRMRSLIGELRSADPAELQYDSRVMELMREVMHSR